MDEVTFLILKVVLSVAAALVTAYLIPYIKARTSAETQDRVNLMIATAVRAAEQTIQGGAKKKDEVVAYAAHWLAEHNIRMTSDQLNTLIEGIVYEVKQEKKEAAQ